VPQPTTVPRAPKSSEVGRHIVPESFNWSLNMTSSSRVEAKFDSIQISMLGIKNLQGHHVAFLCQAFLLSPENKSYVRNCVAVEPCFVITHLQGGQLGCCAVFIFHCVVSMHPGKDYSVEQLEEP
jgi:hypothetical protein